ncbi:MAG: metallophosphoesterase family protein [Ferrimicrobium sp.]
MSRTIGVLYGTGGTAIATIVHISDLHFERLPERLFVGVQGSLDASLDAIRSCRPDLVVVSGDLTSYGCWDQGELIGVKRWLDRIGSPYLVVPGNHDLSANQARGSLYPVMEHYEAMEWSKTNFALTFRQAPVVRYDLDSISIIGFGIRDGDPDGTLALLRAEIAASRRPVVVVGHYPLRATRAVGVLLNFGFQGYIDSSHGVVLEAVTSPDAVCAYLCGHVHAASVVALTPRVVQLSAGGLGPGASRGWVLETTANGIFYTPLTGAGPMTFWPEHSLGGSDPISYHLGTPAEQHGTIAVHSKRVLDLR